MKWNSGEGCTAAQSGRQMFVSSLAEGVGADLVAGPRGLAAVRCVLWEGARPPSRTDSADVIAVDTEGFRIHEKKAWRSCSWGVGVCVCAAARLDPHPTFLRAIIMVLKGGARANYLPVLLQSSKDVISSVVQRGPHSGG